MAEQNHNPTPDRANTYPWPPILYAIVFAVSALLERLFPATPALPESLLTRWIGLLIFLAGIGIVLMGIIRFRAHDTTVNPVGAATALVTDGIFAHTRNPLYLGALIGFLGLGLALRSTWLLLSVVPLAVALQRLAIEPEEAHLGRRFGAAYRAYCQRTRRWI